MTNYYDTYSYSEDGEDLYGDQEKDLAEITIEHRFNDYQVWTAATAIYPPESALEYLTLGLTSEAGEVAGKVKKYIRDGDFNRDDAIAELGDVLWYVARLADELDVDLSVVVKANYEKLESRKERNTITGSGDNR